MAQLLHNSRSTLAKLLVLALSFSNLAHSGGIVQDANGLADSYDYVIVGGGTAGLTLGDRLSEDGKNSVLVVEYGDLVNVSAITEVQGGFQGMNPEFMFSLTSVPQTNLRNRRAGVFAGKVLGGTSAINAMMAIRGTAEDYDRWGRFFGPNSTWSWEGMLPYFKKAISFIPLGREVALASNITYDQRLWGNTSRVFASWPSYQYPSTKAIVDAFRAVPGVEFPRDGGEGRTGVYWYPQFSHPQTVTRSFSRTGHWDEVHRENYEVILNSKVTRVLFNGTRAVGVAFVQSEGGAGLATTVNARKEVILSAGAIHSPHILQLSGVGPRRLLESAKIPVVAHVPGVGQNFQDHPTPSASFDLRNFPIRPIRQDFTSNASFRAWADDLWAASRQGPRSIATGNVAAWLSLPVISPARHADIADALAAQDPAACLPADADATVVKGYGAQMASYAAAMRRNDTAFYNFVVNSGGAPGSSVVSLEGGSAEGWLVALHQLSRGSVDVDPADAWGRPPVVDYRALSNPLDRDVMVEMIRFTRRFFVDNPAMARYEPVELQPGAGVVSFEALSATLPGTVSPTMGHPVGTCAMMPLELGGVVDEELRVYGVQGLRVVDGSVMPTIVGANPSQTIYGIAEKAADIIKAGDTGI
ncbi:hypothetical protein ACKVWC_003543 [Pyricularia oryzae]